MRNKRCRRVASVLRRTGLRFAPKRGKFRRAIATERSACREFRTPGTQGRATMPKPAARNGTKRAPRVTELPKITVHSETREILAHAAKEKLPDDYFIVDVDAHVTETAFWSEITDR